MSVSSIILEDLNVHFDDLDGALVVYHANYLKFLDRARNAILLKCGWDVTKQLAEGFAFAVVSSNSSFRRPLMMDSYVVATQIAGLSPRSVVFRHAIGSADCFVGNQNIDNGLDVNFFNETKVVCVSVKDAQSISIPEQVAKGLSRL